MSVRVGLFGVDWADVLAEPTPEVTTGASGSFVMGESSRDSFRGRRSCSANLVAGVMAGAAAGAARPSSLGGGTGA